MWLKRGGKGRGGEREGREGRGVEREGRRGKIKNWIRKKEEEELDKEEGRGRIG